MTAQQRQIVTRARDLDVRQQLRGNGAITLDPKLDQSAWIPTVRAPRPGIFAAQIDYDGAST